MHLSGFSACLFSVSPCFVSSELWTLGVSLILGIPWQLCLPIALPIVLPPAMARDGLQAWLLSPFP